MELTLPKRLLTLVFNYIPFFHFLSLAAIVYFRLPWWLFFLVLYLIPPFIARIVLLISPIKNTRFQIGSREYFTWWCVFCLQGLYSRFPFLEELLRVVPSLYSIWLRFWGAKVGKLTYWTAGTIILDRPFVNIGNFITFGANVRINPHVAQGNELVLADVIIEDNVIVGGYSLLTAGTVLKANQTTKAFLISSPFSIWEGNKRIFK